MILVVKGESGEDWISEIRSYLFHSNEKFRVKIKYE